MTFEITVPQEYDGMKPKNFLSKQIQVPFHELLNLLRDKRITQNGKKIKQETILKAGDIIKFWPKDLLPKTTDKKHKTSQDLGIKTIFENEDFIVLNKKAGIVVQGAQDSSESLSLHLAYLKEKNLDTSEYEYMHVHRIDKDTSGIIVIGKNLVTTRDLNKVFHDKQIIKKYWCVCLGHLKDKEGKIELNLDRNPEGSRQKVCVNPQGKPTLSVYKVLKEFTHKGKFFSLVEIEIKTGFMHQIRVHMKHLGHPLLGDVMYGSSLVNEEFKHIMPRQALHAHEIAFAYQGQEYSFLAPLPQDLERLLSVLEE